MFTPLKSFFSFFLSRKKGKWFQYKTARNVFVRRINNGDISSPENDGTTGEQWLSVINLGLGSQHQHDTTVPYGTIPESMYNVHDNIDDLIVRYCLAAMIYLIQKYNLRLISIEEQPMSNYFDKYRCVFLSKYVKPDKSRTKWQIFLFSQ